MALAADSTNPPEIAQGTVIRASYGTLVCLCAGCAVLVVVCALLLWDTWGHEHGEHILPFALGKQSLHSSFGAVLGVFGGSVCAIMFASMCLFPHRLILGDEVLQVVRPRWLGSTVELQVPYANIESVTCERVEHGLGQLRLGIDLHDRDATGTYSRKRHFGDRNKDGHDFYVDGIFTLGMPEVAGLIEERRRRPSPVSSRM